MLSSPMSAKTLLMSTDFNVGSKMPACGVWRDTADLWPGEDWRIKIGQAITTNALVFLACFSLNSLSREKSYQNEELTLAIDQMRLRRPGEPWLIPIRFDECNIPDINIGGGRSLGSIQRADLFGDRFTENAERLVKAVQRILRSHGGPTSNDANNPVGENGPDFGDASEHALSQPGIQAPEHFTASAAGTADGTRPVRDNDVTALDGSGPGDRTSRPRHGRVRSFEHSPADDIVGGGVKKTVASPETQERFRQGRGLDSPES